MAGKSRISTWSVFRIAVLPCLLLFSIFKKPVFQWLALGVLLIWIAAELIGLLAKSGKKRKNGKRKPRQRTTFAEDPIIEEPVDNSLLMQVNYRITEQLRITYPTVAWMWLERPGSEDIKRGGTWRISLENAEPFTNAEIQLKSSGAMDISLMQIMPFVEVVGTPDEDGNDLKAEEVLDRFDVNKWYTQGGEDKLCGIVEELNTQGYKRLKIRENGEVMIGSRGAERRFETIIGFPPKSTWPDLCALIHEADIQASIEETQLAIAW